MYLHDGEDHVETVVELGRGRVEPVNYHVSLGRTIS
jgi:hypothetical protein